MNKIFLILIVVIIILVIGFLGYYYLFAGNKTPSINYNIQTQEQTSQQNSSSQQTPAQTTAAVSIENFSFNPGTLTIKAGTTVTWTNKDSVTHKIKSDTFNSDYLNQGNTFQFKFDSKGEYNYSCAIHPSMTGKIIVE